MYFSLVIINTVVAVNLDSWYRATVTYHYTRPCMSNVLGVRGLNLGYDLLTTTVCTSACRLQKALSVCVQCSWSYLSFIHISASQCQNLLPPFTPLPLMRLFMKRLMKWDFSIHVSYASSYRLVTQGDVKEDEMGGACSSHGRDEKCIQHFGRKTWREETTRKAWE
jgi:hypothetical protein